MNADMQQFVAIVIVALAAAYVAWTVVSRMRRRDAKGCGSACSGCSSEESLGEKKAFVSIDSLGPAGKAKS